MTIDETPESSPEEAPVELQDTILEPPVPAPPPAPHRPTRTSDRVDTIDILRGLALFGILAANMRGFAGPALVYFDPDKLWPLLHDRLAQAFIDTFIQGKFITIFAFLFGAGFMVQLERSEGKDVRFGRFYVKRLFLLMAIGLIHGLLIWWGDILFVYGLTGLFLLLFRKRQSRTLIAWGVLLYIVPLGFMALFYLMGSLLGDKMGGGPPQTTPAQLQAMVEVFANGSLADIQKQRMKDAVGMNYAFAPIFAQQILALFLFGAVAWRRGFFRPSPESLPRYRRWMIVGLSIGIIGNLAATLIKWFFPSPMFPPSGTTMLAQVIHTISVPALSAGYACTVILLCQSEKWKQRLSRFGAIGRTALSNYLLQSVVCTLIFYSYGFGLFGTAGPALLLIPTVIIYALQALIAPWWMARYKFGPVEWLWRSLSYGKRQPMVREAVPPGPVELV